MPPIPAGHSFYNYQPSNLVAHIKLYNFAIRPLPHRGNAIINTPPDLLDIDIN